MRSYLLVVLVLLSLSVRAQNIVPNPTFELQTSCPDFYFQLDRAIGWYTPNLGRPDYFNNCTIFSDISVPTNVYGTQSSRTEAYAGAFVYTEDPWWPDYHDYIATTIPALHIGTSYRVTIKLSLADTSYYACKSLGVFFYKDFKPDSTKMESIAVTPQIDYSSFPAVKNKSIWTILSKTFVADSAYTHLIIGNFKHADSTIFIVAEPGMAEPGMYAYYYFDSVAVEDATPAVVNAMDNNIINVQISPNPFFNQCSLTFANPYAALYELSILNVEGRSVRVIGNINTSEVTIYRNELKRGLYFYELRGPDNSVARGKLVID